MEDKKKEPPFDQVPDEKPMPTLKRKEARLDEKKESYQVEPGDSVQPSIAPWLDCGNGDAEICGLPPGEVFNNLELCNRGVAEFNRQASMLNSRVEDIKTKLKRVNQISFILNKHQQRLGSMNPRNPHDAIKAFQQRTQEKRMAAVEKTQEFIKGGGNLKELSKALDPRSPLDKSYSRPGGFGTKRPLAGPLHKPQNV